MAGPNTELAGISDNNNGSTFNAGVVNDVDADVGDALNDLNSNIGVGGRSNRQRPIDKPKPCDTFGDGTVPSNNPACNGSFPFGKPTTSEEDPFERDSDLHNLMNYQIRDDSSDYSDYSNDSSIESIEGGRIVSQSIPVEPSNINTDTDTGVGANNNSPLSVGDVGGGGR